MALVHVDCDIYSSAIYVLRQLFEHGRIVSGTTIVFDELFNQPKALWNEHLALFEFLEESKLGMKMLAIHHKARALSETLDLLKAGRFPTREMQVDTRKSGYWWQSAAIEITDTSFVADRESTAAAEKLDAKFLALSHLHFSHALRSSHNVA